MNRDVMTYWPLTCLEPDDGKAYRLLEKGWHGITFNRVSKFEYRALKKFSKHVENSWLSGFNEYGKSDGSYPEYTEACVFFKNKADLDTCLAEFDLLPRMTEELILNQFDRDWIQDHKKVNYLVTVTKEGQLLFTCEDKTDVLVTVRLMNA